MRAYATITVDDLDAPVVTLTLNRPARLNALTLAMVDELREVFEALSERAPRALILTGAGRAFCAGADLIDTPFGAVDRGAFVADAMATRFNPMVAALNALRCPRIAAVNGVAAGGGASLALLCDLVVAARSATFVQVFAPKLGLVPDLGATWTLPRLVGRARALGLALLGDALDAPTAAAWGLIWQAVDDAALMDTARALAARLAAGPTQAFVETARAMDQAPGHTLEVQLELEREAQRRLAAHDDFAEALAAFGAKRAPVFGRPRG